MKTGTKSIKAAGLALAGLALTLPSVANAGPDEYIGELILVGYNFCPRDTIEADGRLLEISKNTALFSLYGTMYGGDGRRTFALPDMRGTFDRNGNALKYCVVTEGIFPSRS